MLSLHYERIRFQTELAATSSRLYSDNEYHYAAQIAFSGDYATVEEAYSLSRTRLGIISALLLSRPRG